jgi:hypothetical protein
MKHDALFKMLLKTPTLLQGFFDAFLPEIGRFVDFSNIEFVDKEGFTLDHKKRTGDLLIKTQFRGEAVGFLIHLEHQAQRDSDLAMRMLEYVMLDWREYRLPVYPIAVLTHHGPVPVSPLTFDFPNKMLLRFNFDVIDLRHMDAEPYVKMANPAALALASRMRFRSGNRLRLIKDFALTLARMMPSQPVRDRIAAFFFAYQRLSSPERLQLQKEISKVESKEIGDQVMELTNPWIEAGKEQGRQEGWQQGRQEGEVELVLRQLSRRIGAISASQGKAIRKLPLQSIEALGEALLEFASSTDLVRWLRLHK